MATFSLCLRPLQESWLARLYGVSADGVGLICQQSQVGIDFGFGRHDAIDCALPLLKRRKENPECGKARRFLLRPVQQRPKTDANDCNGGTDQKIDSRHGITLTHANVKTSSLLAKDVFVRVAYKPVSAISMLFGKQKNWLLKRRLQYDSR